MACQIRQFFWQFFSKLLCLSAVVLLLAISFGAASLPATASIRTMEEAPGQILVQSRHTLRDNTGNSWQVVLFKRVKNGAIASVDLRLVGFPGAAEVAPAKPLQITTRDGKIFAAADRFSGKSPAANVGEYMLQDILPQLPVNSSLRLLLPISGERSSQLEIPLPVVLEWQDIATHSN